MIVPLLTHAAIALAPVPLFLVILLAMDSFKLVRPRSVFLAIAAGAAAAVASLLLQQAAIEAGLGADTVRRYAAPISEEALKAAFVARLIAKRRVGFLVDATVQGFAVGTGFAMVENLQYLRVLGTADVWLWTVRGLGTAVLHGAATSVFAMIAKARSDRDPAHPLRAFVPALGAAIALHAAFNNLPLPPVAKTLALLTLLPAVALYIFHLSERATREWVGAGLDLDLELLDLVGSEHFAATRLGAYLQQLRLRFGGLVVANMFCLLRLELELSIRAKALLVARQAGLQLRADEELSDALEEMRYLRGSIGRTGLLALRPMEVTSQFDEWHRHLLQELVRGRG